MGGAGALRRGRSAQLRLTVNDRPGSYFVLAVAELTPSQRLASMPIWEQSTFGEDAGFLVYSGFPGHLETINQHLMRCFVLPGKRPFRYVKSNKASPYLPRCYRPVGPWYRIAPGDDLDPTCKAELVLRKGNVRDAPFLELVANLVSSPALVGYDRFLRVPLPEE